MAMKIFPSKTCNSCVNAYFVALTNNNTLSKDFLPFDVDLTSTPALF